MSKIPDQPASHKDIEQTIDSVWSCTSLDDQSIGQTITSSKPTRGKPPSQSQQTPSKLQIKTKTLIDLGKSTIQPVDGRSADAPDYKLLSILGQGGMGMVYRAEQTAIGRSIALKMLRSEIADQAVPAIGLRQSRHLRLSRRACRTGAAPASLKAALKR